MNLKNKYAVSSKTLIADINKIFDKLAMKHSYYTVIYDFVDMAICANHVINFASNCTEKDADNEAIYMAVIKKYNSEELNDFAKILAGLRLILEQEPFSDPLGDIYMEHLSNEKNGQFFTPSSICEMLTRLSGAENAKDYCTVSDPACGSGRMLLAFASVHPIAYFFGVDIDIFCAKMTVLNLMLNGLMGEIVWGDSLALDYKGIWQVNMGQVGILPIKPDGEYYQKTKKSDITVLHDVSQIKDFKNIPKPILPSKEGSNSSDNASEQLTLGF